MKGRRRICEGGCVCSRFKEISMKSRSSLLISRILSNDISLFDNKRLHSITYIIDSFLRYCSRTSQNFLHGDSDSHISQNIFHWAPMKLDVQFKIVIYGPLRTYKLQKAYSTDR